MILRSDVVLENGVMHVRRYLLSTKMLSWADHQSSPDYDVYDCIDILDWASSISNVRRHIEYW